VIIILINKIIKIKLNSKHIKHFEELGYTIPRELNKYNRIAIKKNAELEVNVFDLPLQSNIVVDVICDYCGEEYKISLDNRYKYYNNGIIKKDACKNCAKLKRQESMMLTYGVEYALQLNKNKEKMFNTNKIRYGVKIPIQNEEIKNKIKNTCIEKYNVDCPSKNDDVKQKTKNTCIEKYGVDNPMKNDEFKEKSKETLFQNYGVSSPCQNPDILLKVQETNIKKYGCKWSLQNKEIRLKSKKSLYKNGTAQCSKQQLYIHNIIGGELNYSVDNLNLDIAFPKEMIYVEYNGGGHDLSVKLKKISKKTFQIKEIKRYKFLKSLGWKEIKIISEKDFVPTKDCLLNIFIESKNNLLSNKNINHITIILDKNSNYDLVKL